MQSSKMIVLDNLNQLMNHASSCTSRSGGSLTSSIGDVLQLNQSCHRSTVRSNFSSYLCVIVSSWSTLGTIKPDLLGVHLFSVFLHSLVWALSRPPHFCPMGATIVTHMTLFTS
ncbi:hypothetical protein ILYODFUR_027536 [Ilyodon furcidens]|uniref:Uncharacterized protein n=1 Tax=Ilyodon furcidens TaxID=33524 RepID=A0ABV0UVV9_9TELE